MNAIYTNDIDVKKVALAAYPDYSGRKFKVVVETSPINVSSYWDGGSNNYFVFLRLDNLKTWEMPGQSINDVKVEGAENVSLIPGMVCVEHTYFCGKDLGITIHVHPENAPKSITEQVELTREEKIVLVFTRSYKNTYAGMSNYRYHEACRSKQISLEQWETAKASLTAKGYLNKYGAITMEGKNVIGETREYDI
jgi:hypothetical protein